MPITKIELFGNHYIVSQDGCMDIQVQVDAVDVEGLFAAPLLDAVQKGAKKLAARMAGVPSGKVQKVAQ